MSNRDLKREAARLGRQAAYKYELAAQIMQMRQGQRVPSKVEKLKQQALELTNEAQRLRDKAGASE